MESHELIKVMDKIRTCFHLSRDCEITMEANPGTIDREKARTMARAGINRLSIGLQSADPGELKLLGRIHTWEDFEESYVWAREAGIKNINVDLMSALPGQDLKSWETTLNKVIEKNPEHISAYSLIIEEGTPFYQIYGETEEQKNRDKWPSLPGEDEDRKMYALTGQMLKSAGYARYEISNYARPGFECRHNTGYWLRKDYLGLGLGAASLMDGRRFENTRDLKAYLNGDFSHKNIQILSRADAMAEFMFLGLRLINGVWDKDFIRTFGKSFMEVYGEPIRQHCQEGLLYYIEETGQLALTERGIDVSNYVLCDFL